AAGRTCAGRTAGTAGRARTARTRGSGDFLRRVLHLAARSRRAGRTGRTRAGSAARTAGRTGGAARTDAALEGDGQSVADHLAVVVGDSGVHGIRLVGQQRVHDEGHRRAAGGLLRLDAVDIPVQVF